MCGGGGVQPSTLLTCRACSHASSNLTPHVSIARQVERDEADLKKVSHGLGPSPSIQTNLWLSTDYYGDGCHACTAAGFVRVLGRQTYNNGKTTKLFTEKILVNLEALTQRTLQEFSSAYEHHTQAYNHLTMRLAGILQTTTQASRGQVRKACHVAPFLRVSLHVLVVRPIRL